MALFPTQLRAQSHDPWRKRALPDSIREIPSVDGATVVRPHARILRKILNDTEQSEMLEIEVALKMRGLDELKARVAAGETISKDEMEANYWPLPADYEKVEQWLRSLGLTITRTVPNRLAIFARGNIAQLAQAFQANFARVEDNEGAQFTSAITAPAVPEDIADLIVGINGLQPHIRPHKHAQALRANQTFFWQYFGSNSPPYLPSQLAKAYSANGLNFTGSGQIIALIEDAYPASSDLTTFWSLTSVNQSTSNISNINVSGGPGSAAADEATADIEWSSAMAPAAKLRVYGVPNLLFTTLDRAYQQIYNDLSSNPGISTLSLSYGLGETYISSSQLQTDANLFLTLASAGVTIFASSGDNGSTPDNNGGSSGPIQPEYPASDPSVTGVGGTTLTLDSSTGAVSNESVWNSTWNNGSSHGSTGGGISLFFSRPSWQIGTGVSDGTQRLVPDIAMDADPNTGVYVRYQGNNYAFGGTSVGPPVWAGFCALINESRAASGNSSIGLLGPNIYPLNGSSAFRDITSGSNGTYSAGTGYDLCTGLGTPNVAALIQALTPALTQSPAQTSSSSGSSGNGNSGGGGGGAPSWWFYGTLIALATSRWLLRLRNVARN